MSSFNKYEITRQNTLIDLNESLTNFNVDFNVDETSKKRFYIAIVTQQQLDAGDIDMKIINDGYIAGKLQKNENVYHSYYIVLRSADTDTCECNVTINLRDLGINRAKMANNQARRPRPPPTKPVREKYSHPAREKMLQARLQELRVQNIKQQRELTKLRGGATTPPPAGNDAGKTPESPGSSSTSKLFNLKTLAIVVAIGIGLYVAYNIVNKYDRSRRWFYTTSNAPSCPQIQNQNTTTIPPRPIAQSHPQPVAPELPKSTPDVGNINTELLKKLQQLNADS